MKYFIIFVLVTAALLFSGCGDGSKKAAAEATVKTVQTETPKAKSETLTQEVKAEVKKVLSKDIVGQTEGNAGKDLYAKCSGCHGLDGKTKALGKSAVIAGQPADELINKLNAYKTGKRDVSGMGTLMKGQVVSLSESDILAVSQYISGL
jgi:cytochrome c553